MGAGQDTVLTHAHEHRAFLRAPWPEADQAPALGSISFPFQSIRAWIQGLLQIFGCHGLQRTFPKQGNRASILRSPYRHCCPFSSVLQTGTLGLGR